MKWTNKQFKDAAIIIIKWKAKLALLDKTWKDHKGIRATFTERLQFKKIRKPIEEKIDQMENDFLLSIAHYGIEEDDNDAEPPDQNKKE